MQNIEGLIKELVSLQAQSQGMTFEQVIKPKKGQTKKANLVLLEVSRISFLTAQPVMVEILKINRSRFTYT